MELGVTRLQARGRLRINAPLIFSEAEADEALGVLDESLTEVEGHRAHAVAKSA